MIQPTPRAVALTAGGAPVALAIAREPTGRLPPRLEVARAFGPRLAAADDRLTLPAATDRAVLRVRPIRRGTEVVDRLWTRWTGPLGLARRGSSRR